MEQRKPCEIWSLNKPPFMVLATRRSSRTLLVSKKMKMKFKIKCCQWGLSFISGLSKGQIYMARAFLLQFNYVFIVTLQQLLNLSKSSVQSEIWFSALAKTPRALKTSCQSWPASAQVKFDHFQKAALSLILCALPLFILLSVNHSKFQPLPCKCR